VAEPPEPDLPERALPPRGRPWRAAIARRGIEPHALFAVVLLTAVWTWWAWKQGAYFGTVMLPGAIVLCAGAVVLAVSAPWRVRLARSWPAKVAIVALTGLGAWTLLSAIWSPAPDIALADAQRVLTYALVFGLGIWLCNLVGRRLELALVPLAAAGAIVAVATTVTLLVGRDLATYLDLDGTLQFPLGYRNANAAFFLIALWPALALATSPRVDWRLRGLALGAATLCLELGLLGQSRGSSLALPVALFVYLLAAPRRARALLWLALAAVPALLIVPHLSVLYHAGNGHRPPLEDVRSAARAAAIGAGLAVLLGAAVARLTSSVALPGRVSSGLDRAVAVGLILAPLAAVAAFVIVVGNPATWIDRKLVQFQGGESAQLSRQATRFGFNTGTGRGDLWRIALDEGAANPLLGDGAGGYRYAYLLQRRTVGITVRDAHSVELETLSELGVPGLALLALAVGGAAAGVVRARRIGLPAASLGGAALAAGAYWLVHASIDWFWPYPAVTAPVICLAGAACAPALRTAAPTRRVAGRRALAAATVLLALSAIPPFLSQRYVNAAFAEWRADRPQAYADLDAAGRWNPWSEDPLLAEGAIAREAGARRRAIDAFTAAVRKRPDDWAPHYYLASLYADSAPARARSELAAAFALDPGEPALVALRQRLAAGR
jgi:O-antigen ligase/polysaccharide polymerase Wzy-like membrane protein